MKNRFNVAKLLVIGVCLFFVGFAFQGLSTAQNRQASDGPANQGTRAPRQDGDATAGRAVFRFETFGNEGFWTDAARVPQGIVAAKVTPLKALQLGLSVDVDALDPATQQAVAKELQSDPTGMKSKLFNDPKTTLRLLNANAVIGLVVKDSNGDGNRRQDGRGQRQYSWRYSRQRAAALARSRAQAGVPARQHG